MRQEREQPMDKGLGAKEHGKSGASIFNERQAFSFGGEGQEDGLLETRLALRQEGSVDNREKKPSRKDSDQKLDGVEPAQRGFEPFLNQEFKEEDLFVNNYGGAYSQKMELNRRGVERALEIARLRGKVFLTAYAPSLSRAEVQGNELAAKRFLLFERKTQKVEEENPYKRVVSVPEGWRIEINDQRITEELSEKRLAGQKLQKAFIDRFNRQLTGGLRECVWREKCSSEKDPHFRWKLFWSLLGPVLQSSVMAPFLLRNPSVSVALNYGWVFISYGAINALGGINMRERRHFGNMLKEIDPNFRPSSPDRKIDHKWEYFMPPVEIDKVARTYTYLAGKGRRLVREIKD